jgi:glycerophosphoryl diester phosphodiesterase
VIRPLFTQILAFALIVLASQPASAIESEPEIMAHRGAFIGGRTEGTLQSFAQAHAAGADWIEFDVRWTADNVMVVNHDFSLERTTNCPQLVRELTWAYIQANCRTPEGYRVPSFAQAMNYLALRGVKIAPQIAPPTRLTSVQAAQFYSAIKRSGAASRTIVQSFNVRTLQDLKRYGIPVGVRLAYLWNNTLDRPTPAEARALAKYFAPDFRLVTRAMVAEYQAAGLKVMVWTTMDDEDNLAAIALRPNIICTDDTRGLVEILD